MPLESAEYSVGFSHDGTFINCGWISSILNEGTPTKNALALSSQRQRQLLKSSSWVSDNPAVVLMVSILHIRLC